MAALAAAAAAAGHYSFWPSYRAAAAAAAAAAIEPAPSQSKFHSNLIVIIFYKLNWLNSYKVQ